MAVLFSAAANSAELVVNQKLGGNDQRTVGAVICNACTTAVMDEWLCGVFWCCWEGTNA